MWAKAATAIPVVAFLGFVSGCGVTRAQPADADASETASEPTGTTGTNVPKLAGHANPHVTMRVYADDFRKASERNAAVLERAAERGFGS
jgi:hypothetical protein